MKNINKTIIKKIFILIIPILLILLGICIEKKNNLIAANLKKNQEELLYIEAKKYYQSLFVDNTNIPKEDISINDIKKTREKINQINNSKKDQLLKSINELEKYLTENNFEIETGSVHILFSAPHTMIQTHHDGTVKLSEPYTKAISLYLNKYDKTYSIVKLADTGMDSNRDNNDEYKKALINLVKENGIKLVIDLHGASKDRDFDIEFGTLNNFSADFSTIR